MPHFLFELGTEEIPAGYLHGAAAEPPDGLLPRLVAALAEHGLAPGGAPRAWYTPRRITLFLPALPARQADREEQVWGPPADRGRSGGVLTAAGQGFARKYELAPDAITVAEKPGGKGGAYLTATLHRPGRATAELLAELLPGLLRRLRFPKTMVWVNEQDRAARPVRSLCALLGGEIVRFECFGLTSDRLVYGHPFLAPGPVALEAADLDRYAALLAERFVIADPEQRRARIRARLAEAAAARHAAPIDEPALVEEVANLVEYPGVTVGAFAREYLDLPRPVLVTAMKRHQRYFPLEGPDGALLAAFAAVMNRADDEAGLIRQGNERVLAARLADARFFWQEDRKRPLADHQPALDGIVYLHGMGTLAQKVERLKSLARHLAQYTGTGGEAADHQAQAAHAAEWCKNDLDTHVVGEFPELQGIIGGLLAQADIRDQRCLPDTSGLDDRQRAAYAAVVGAAIREHYQPRFAADALPETPAGRALAAADKLDTLAACFVLGKAPTGAADPYGLRRAARGLLRILGEGLPCPLGDALDEALRLLQQQGFFAPRDEGERRRVKGALREFLRERLRVMLREDEGRPHDHVEAVLAVGFDDLPGVAARLDALVVLAREHWWPDLCRLVERTANIARGSSGDAERPLDESRLNAPEAAALAATLRALAPAFEADLAPGGCDAYVRASTRYFETLHAPVEAFFEKVFVNDPDPEVRGARQALLREIHQLYVARIADLRAIVLAGAGSASDVRSS